MNCDNCVILETKRRQKALHDFLGANKDIRTVGIISPENPMGHKYSASENNKRIERFKEYLKNNKIRYQQIKGQYNSLEHSFLLFNVTVDELSFYGYSFDQESFIFGTFDENSVIHFKYYEKKEGNSPYVLLDSCDGFIKKDNADDFYTIISKNFKFTIPFSIFESFLYDLHNKIQYRKHVSDEYLKSYEYFMERSLNENLTTKSRVLARSILYGTAWTSYQNRDEMLKEENDYLNDLVKLAGC